MNIAVTGAHGFVGLNLSRHLASEGHDVFAIGRREPDVWSERYLAGVADRIHHRQADLACPGELETALGNDRIDAVIHAAVITATTIGVEQENARAIVDVNAGGTMEALLLARSKRARRFVYVSSPAAIGPVASQDAIREDVPLNPATIYGITKMAGEHLVRRAGEIYGLSTVSVRIAQPYGPGERATQSRVRTSPICEWLRDASDGVPLPTGPLDRARDWTYIDDTVRGIATLATSDRTSHGLYHLGIGRQVTVASIVAALRRKFPDLEVDTLPPADVLNPNIAGDSRPPLDVTRFRSEFGWSPETDIDDGMERYVAWWEQFRVELEGCRDPAE